MPISHVQITLNTINVSVQVGDMIYYTSVNNIQSGGFQTGNLDNTYLFGEVIFISPNTIIIEYNSDPPHPGLPQQGDFLSFVKDKKINTSNLVGYYAEANFINNSKEHVELFTVGSEISESSK